MNEPRQENVLFSEGNVKVTTARFVVKTTTYPIAGITAVSHDSIPVSRVLPILLVLVGILALAIKIWLLGIFLALCGILALAFMKPKHTVGIATAGGQIKAVESSDGPYIERIVVALNRAVIER